MVTLEKEQREYLKEILTGLMCAIYAITFYLVVTFLAA